MDEHPPARILLQTADPASARHWADMLRGSDARVWLDWAEIPPDEQPDVVVTDGRGAGCQPAKGTAGWQPAPRCLVTSDSGNSVGVVWIGDDGPAAVGPLEACLPANTTARELQLTCRLLAQIVRLQRQQQAGTEQQRRLAKEALTDPLTGLPNLRAWQRAIEDRLASIRKAALCLAILDLDLFKRVNDTRGHAAGDAVLRACGAAIRQGLRQDDLVARLGGDEFGLLLWVHNAAAAVATVERVRAAIPGRLAAAAVEPITASAGYCLVLQPPAVGATPPDPASLYAAADQALLAAKQAGRNRTCAAESLPPTP